VWRGDEDSRRVGRESVTLRPPCAHIPPRPPLPPCKHSNHYLAFQTVFTGRRFHRLLRRNACPRWRSSRNPLCLGDSHARSLEEQCRPPGGFSGTCDTGEAEISLLGVLFLRLSSDEFALQYSARISFKFPMPYFRLRLSYSVFTKSCKYICQTEIRKGICSTFLTIAS